jgi:CYTH domain-containing protein
LLAGDDRARRPGEGRYARLEREQRWQLATVPAGAAGLARIRDRYLEGTRLRLRHIESEHGEVFKLGQKIRVDESDPERVNITSLYLDAAEFARLAALPGADLTKCRRWLLLDGHRVAVDEFEGRHQGLVLAEVELGNEDAPLALPNFASRDVTRDDRYSGGALAWASDEAIVKLLA